MIAEQITTTGGVLTALDDETCLLETGGNSLLDLAGYLTSLNVDFDVLAPPELRALLGRLAERYAAAADGNPCDLCEPADRFGDMNRKGEPQRPPLVGCPHVPSPRCCRPCRR